MIARMYITMLPTIIGGPLNMLFVKTPLYKKFKSPIDRGLVLSDGRRLFGENKTVIGMFSMAFFCMTVQCIYGLIFSIADISSMNDLYNIHANTVLFNCFAGFLFGLSYMIFELPNSFLKRRCGVDSGSATAQNGIRRYIFFLTDQFDSIIGVILVLKILSGISWKEYFIYVLLGGITHLLVNIILKITKVRKTL